MAASKTAVCQLALGHLGIADQLTDVDTDQTAIARACRTFYDQCRDQLLELQPWAFATRYFDFKETTGTGTVTVTLTNTATFSTSQDGVLDTGDTITIGGVEYVIGARTSGTVWATSGANVSAQAFTIAKDVTDDPTLEWSFAYRVPDNVWLMRKLVDGNRTPIRTNWPVWRMGSDASGRLLYTNWEDPVIAEYTAQVTDVTAWTQSFTNAMAAFLAFHIAPLVTKGDPNKLGDRAFAVYQGYIGNAGDRDANEMRLDDDPDADLVQYRNGAVLPYPMRWPGQN